MKKSEYNKAFDIIVKRIFEDVALNIIDYTDMIETSKKVLEKELINEN